MKIVCNNIDNFKDKVTNEINKEIDNYKKKKKFWLIITVIDIITSLIFITAAIIGSFYLYKNNEIYMSAYMFLLFLGMLGCIGIILPVSNLNEYSSYIDSTNEQFSELDEFCNVLNKWKNKEIIMHSSNGFWFTFYYKNDEKKRIYEVKKPSILIGMIKIEQTPKYLNYKEENTIDLDNLVWTSENIWSTKYEEVTNQI